MHPDCNYSYFYFQVFTVLGDDRPHVKDYLILFTDGQATDKHLAIANARKLKKRNIRIIAIGAGPRRHDFLSQLEQIATSPSDVFMADFDNLEVIVKDIVNEVCPEPMRPPSKLPLTLSVARSSSVLGKCHSPSGPPL